MEIRRKLMLFMRESISSRSCSGRKFFAKWIVFCSDCEPLTPEDIAEAIVFAVGRRENVVVADILIYPSHQVSTDP